LLLRKEIYLFLKIIIHVMAQNTEPLHVFSINIGLQGNS